MTKTERGEWLRKLVAGTLPQTRTVLEVCERIARVGNIRWTCDEAGGIRGIVPASAGSGATYVAGDDGRDGRWRHAEGTTCVCPVAVIEWHAGRDAAAAAEVTESPWDAIDEMAAALTGGGTTRDEDEHLRYRQLVRALHMLVAGSDRRRAQETSAMTLGAHPLQAADRMTLEQWHAAANRTAEACYAYLAWLLSVRDPAPAAWT